MAHNLDRLGMEKLSVLYKISVDKSRILPPRVRLRKKEDIAFYRTLLTSKRTTFVYERILEEMPPVQGVREHL